jgi:hypothetical protein
MSKRQNQERQKELEPKRLERAKAKIRELDLPIIHESDRMFKFVYDEEIITFYPYSGWATGIGINDGRGLDNLLKQLV